MQERDRWQPQARIRYEDGTTGPAIPLGVGGPHDGRKPRRWLVIVNWLLVPYVAVKFPRQAGRYVRGCWRVTWGLDQDTPR